MNEREQPLEELATSSGEELENRVESVNGSQDAAQDLPAQETSQEPCSLGKFKNTQALLDAYNNLQAEFTKKCQRLSVLEKEKIEGMESAALDEEQLQSLCQQFLSQHAEAQGFADQLKDKIRASKAKPSPQSFDDAWAGIVLDHIKNDAGDKIVDKYVLSSESIRKTVIENYIRSLEKSAPPLTISSCGQSVAGSAPVTPSSLSDAKKMMEKMFS